MSLFLSSRRGPSYDLSIWHKDRPAFTVPAESALIDRTGQAAVRHFDQVATAGPDLVSISRLVRPSPGGPRRGIVYSADKNALLQAEGETPPVEEPGSETVKRIDFLTAVPGVGGQTRSVNASGQVTFRAKLSSGKTAIYATSP